MLPPALRVIAYLEAAKGSPGAAPQLPTRSPTFRQFLGLSPRTAPKRNRPHIVCFEIRTVPLQHYHTAGREYGYDRVSISSILVAFYKQHRSRFQNQNETRRHAHKSPRRHAHNPHHHRRREGLLTYSGCAHATSDNVLT